MGKQSSKRKTPRNVKPTSKQIAIDRLRWLATIDKVNEHSPEVKYGLKQCEADGYWYIVPVTKPKAVKLSRARYKTRAKSDEWEMVQFSHRQFRDPYFAWSRSPGSNFILNMEPNNQRGMGEYAGRFSYHPLTHELLLGRITTAHCETIDQFGNYEFNEYQRGMYVKAKRVILIRPYFNPLDENAEFDPEGEYDDKMNKLVTRTTLEMLLRNGLPTSVRIIKDVDNKTVAKYCSAV